VDASGVFKWLSWMTQNATALEGFLFFISVCVCLCVCVRMFFWFFVNFFAGESGGKGGQLMLGRGSCFSGRLFALSFDVLGPRISLITILYLLLAFSSFL